MVAVKEEGLSYRAIRDRLNVSASRAQQIHAKARRLLDQSPAVPFDLVTRETSVTELPVGKTMQTILGKGHGTRLAICSILAAIG